MIWAHEHGCDWDEDTCSYAVERGHLDCLIYAREHGCPWNLSDCRQEAENNEYQDILDWMDIITPVIT